MNFRTRSALIATHSRPPFDDIAEVLPNEDLAFVAVPYLAEGDVSLLRSRLPANVGIATLLPAENFDPLEDHPVGADFTWTPILINDFGEVNDDIGTIVGVRHGHFSRLLDWQPRVDRERTKLIAIIAPGPWNRTKVTEPDSIPLLSTALVSSGYDAIGVRCKAGDDAEFTDAVKYAAALSDLTRLPIFHVSRDSRSIDGTAFSLSVKELP